MPVPLSEVLNDVEEAAVPILEYQEPLVSSWAMEKLRERSFARVAGATGTISPVTSNGAPVSSVMLTRIEGRAPPAMEFTPRTLTARPEPAASAGGFGAPQVVLPGAQKSTVPFMWTSGLTVSTVKPSWQPPQLGSGLATKAAWLSGGVPWQELQALAWKPAVISLGSLTAVRLQISPFTPDTEEHPPQPVKLDIAFGDGGVRRRSR